MRDVIPGEGGITLGERLLPFIEGKEPEPRGLAEPGGHLFRKTAQRNRGGRNNMETLAE